MPEGPSMVIAREEMSLAIGQKVIRVSGNSKLPIKSLKNQILEDIGMWGKHFLLFFTDCTVKIHFLLWGSYRVNEPKDQKPRLELYFKNIRLYFYSCAVSFLENPAEEIYDWSADVMSISWDSKKALEKVKKYPNEMVCDILMDQAIFSGVGNIIKNEVLFNLRLRPQRKVKSLTKKQQSDLVHEAMNYSYQFYEWKKIYELKKHWNIMRKKTYENCGGPVTREVTGKRKRLSHYCKHCQK